MTRHAAPRRRRPRRWEPGQSLMALAVAFGLTLSGALVWRTTDAAFTATTQTGQNTWQTGSVALRHDAVSVPFTVSNMTPGTTGKRCITVTYDGTVTPAYVRLYTANATDGGLGAHLGFTVWEGTGGTADCTGFQRISDNPIFQGTAGQLAAVTGWSANVGWWNPTTTGETRTYEISYTLGVDAPQSSSYAVAFVWEARTTAPTP